MIVLMKNLILMKITVLKMTIELSVGILMKITVLKMTIELSVGAVTYSSRAINFTNRIYQKIGVKFHSVLIFL